jgi:hypothetical protein
MSEPQTQIVEPFATNPVFQEWSERRGQGFQFVYAGQGDGVWKFTSEEWWRFVTRTVHNNGALTLPCSKKIADLGWYSGITSRYVDLLYWTLEDWKNELRAT